jgi:small-conductance mechanosensitive channel
MEHKITGDVTDLVTKDLIYGNSLVSWIQAGIIFGAIFVVLVLLKIFFSSRYKKLRASNPDKFNFKVILFSFLKKINFLVMFFVALYPAVEDLVLPKHIGQILKFLFIVAIFFQIYIWINNAINLYSENYIRKHIQRDPTSVTAVHIFTVIWKISACAVIVLVMLDQLGFNITTLLAGLGVGGIAVAFALQNILSDIFGSLAIIFDKPFKVGDTIQIDDQVGTVEKVGLKTTRLRSINGEVIIYSNTEHLKKMIRNFYDLQERRFRIVLGVTYETPYEKLKEVPDLIRKVIFSQPGTSVTAVSFKTFGESSLNFEVIYNIREPSPGEWMKIEHNINMEMMRVFTEKGISFAYPTRTVYTKTL